MWDKGGCLWVQVCDGCWRCSWQEGSLCCKCSSNRNPRLTQSWCFLQSNLFLYSRWTICVGYSQVWIFFAGLHIKNENAVLRTVRPELKFFRSSWLLLITSSLIFTSFVNAKSLGVCALFCICRNCAHRIELWSDTHAPQLQTDIARPRSTTSWIAG